MICIICQPRALQQETYIAIEDSPAETTVQLQHLVVTQPLSPYTPPKVVYKDPYFDKKFKENQSSFVVKAVSDSILWIKDYGACCLDLCCGGD